MTRPLRIEAHSGDQAEAWARVFIAKAGASLRTFRYFYERNPAVVRQHRLTLFGFAQEELVAYGHIDAEHIFNWLGVCVAADYVGVGYGRQMVEALVEFADAHGLDLQLAVDVDNGPARQLYASVGFTAAFPEINERLWVRRRKQHVPETIGSLVDKLATVNQKMFLNQEILYEIRRMTFEEYKAKYFDSVDGAQLLWESLKKVCDLNMQRVQLVEEVDSKIVEVVRGLLNGEAPDRFVQPQHKTY